MDISGGENAAKRETQVSEQINALEKSTATLVEEFAVTEGLLNPVTRIHSIDKSAEEKKQEQELVPLANRIRNIRFRLEMVIRHVRDLNANCEL